MTKRIVSLLLALAVLTSLCVPVFAYDAAKALPSLTGDQARDTANIAASQIGYTENGGTVYGAWWNTVTNWGIDYTNLDWCGMFACWCANQAGAGLNVAYNKNGALADGLFTFLKENATYDTAFATAPRVGDFIFFSDDPGGNADHVAVVTAYDPSTNAVTFVGGNQSNMVSRKTCTWSASGMYGSQYVIGYGRPNYKTSEVSYLDQCIGYPCYLKVEAETATELNTMPCTVAANPKSTAVYEAKAGDAFTAVGLYKNTEGNYWYQVSHNGKTCYVYARDVKVTSAMYTDLAISDVVGPVSVKKGSGFTLGGTVKTVSNAVYSVTAYVKQGGANVLSSSATVNTRSYELKNSTVDQNLSFGKLDNGDYVYAVSATVRNYFSADGKVLKYYTYTKQMHANAFRVSASGSEKPTTYAVSFDANGGTVGLTGKLYEYGSTYGAMPTPEREGYTFVGWYTTADTGGTPVTGGHTVTASRTLYARWSCVHVWEQTSHTDGDCENDGMTEYLCATCGQTRSEVAEAPGHKWTVTDETRVSCETDGSITSVCLTCGEEETRIIAAAPGHDWFVSSEREAGCELPGQIIEDCRNCSASVVTQTGPALGHSWDGAACAACGRLRENPFTDVTPADYFFEPVLWACYSGITAGTSPTTFSPGNACTRAQVVTFLWRAGGSPEPETGENPFDDVDEGAYYYQAVLWAVERGIASGTSDSTFSPDRPCTRAQVAAFLYRADGSPQTGPGENPFEDVAAAAYYCDAVLWAVERGITSGVGEGRFGPDKTCTRGQIAAFLYRARN